MANNSSQDETISLKEKKSKAKRADIQIYRPGALKLKKENEKLMNSTGISEKELNISNQVESGKNYHKDKIKGNNSKIIKNIIENVDASESNENFIENNIFKKKTNTKNINLGKKNSSVNKFEPTFKGKDKYMTADKDKIEKVSRNSIKSKGTTRNTNLKDNTGTGSNLSTYENIKEDSKTEQHCFNSLTFQNKKFQSKSNISVKSNKKEIELQQYSSEVEIKVIPTITKSNSCDVRNNYAVDIEKLEEKKTSEYKPKKLKLYQPPHLKNTVPLCKNELLGLITENKTETVQQYKVSPVCTKKNLTDCSMKGDLSCNSSSILARSNKDLKEQEKNSLDFKDKENLEYLKRTNTKSEYPKKKEKSSNFEQSYGSKDKISKVEKYKKTSDRPKESNFRMENDQQTYDKPKVMKTCKVESKKYSNRPIEKSTRIETSKKYSNRSRNIKQDVDHYDEEVNDSSISEPMNLLSVSENSFYKNKISSEDSRDHKRSKSMKQSSTTGSNTSWGDEKWSPAQRERIRKSRNRDHDLQTESPTRRGIIQVGATTNQDNSTVGTTNKCQKHLYNPENPSKAVAVAVVPSARDLPPNWDQYSSPKERGNETPKIGSTINFDSQIESEKLDPSLFHSIEKGEMDINYYVSSNQLPQEFQRILDIREHLKSCYRQLLVTDIRHCQEKNIENALWKSLYYSIIEKLREYISREPSLRERSQTTLMMLVDDGLKYLESLLVDLQLTYKFSLETHWEDDLMTGHGSKNRVRLALNSCQKILLCKGDLARYKEQFSSIPNYSNAKTQYEKALAVNPRNGRPFNQLAIIAVTQKRPLDVVYYYIRSLTASNPFTSARDSLITMFEDIRRKYENMEKLSTMKDKEQIKTKDEYHLKNTEGNLRQEIWVRPDSGATNKRTLSHSDQEEEVKNIYLEEIKKLSPDQIWKQFLTSYLHCHGMLFSKVGLDHYMEVLTLTLHLFQYLLKLNPQKLSSLHLMQIMAVNIYAVDNNQLRDSSFESGYRSAAQDLALLLSQEMFGRIAEAMVTLFPKSLNMDNCEERLFLPYLAHFIPAAKVWCDWLLYNSSIWNPPPVSHEFFGLDVWSVIAELATLVKGIGPSDIHTTENPQGEGFVPIILAEDVFLRSYAPLLSAHRSPYYTPKNSNIHVMDRASDWVRLKRLQLCLGQFLCGVEPPVLRLQKTERADILVSIVAITPPDSPAFNRESFSSSERDLEESLSDFESNSEDDLELEDIEEGSTCVATAVRILTQRKKMLEKKQRQQKKRQALVEGCVTLEIEVHPRYLVPDTNCFIEHLEIIQALEKNRAYTIMVPLIVLGELDGLSRDAAVEKYGDASHAVKVREGAAAAVHYVTGSKHSQLKCVTSQGSVLPSTRFTDEIDTFKDVSNDDKILSCCLHLCNNAKDKCRPVKDGIRRLHREVVLLTEDRNLRVKAYARDVPVRDLMDFSHWAGVK